MIHRNTYVNSPHHLQPTFQFRKQPNWFLAGQITGVEGYVESAASGLQAGIHMARYLSGHVPAPFPPTTAMGALAHYVSHAGHSQFQPTNINFGIMAPLEVRGRLKRSERRERKVIRALEDMQEFGSALAEDLQPISEELLPIAK